MAQMRVQGTVESACINLEHKCEIGKLWPRSAMIKFQHVSQISSRNVSKRSVLILSTGRLTARIDQLHF